MNTKINYEQPIKQISHFNNLTLYSRVQHSAKHISEIIYGECLPFLVAGKLSPSIAFMDKIKF